MNKAGNKYPYLTRILLIPLLFVVLGQASVPTQVLPKSVVIVIGDGMGFQHVKAARDYLGRALSFEKMPYQAQVTTANANGFITDSAAGGTAIATGHKVINGVISVQRPGDGSNMQTLLEYFKARGRSTGLVTTASLTDATPAAFGAHEPSRGNRAQIANDYLTESRPEVLLGGGSNGLSLESAQAAGYTTVTDRAGLLALDTSRPRRISGQFGRGDLPYEHDGLGMQPHLRDMARIALARLERDPDGFFLLIEGGLIDHASHHNNIEHSIDETLELSRTVRLVLNWARGRSDVLVLVLADHETGGLTIQQDNGPGAAPTVTWSSMGHSSANIPLYAWGVGAEQFSGTLDNTDLFSLIVNAGY